MLKKTSLSILTAGALLAVAAPAMADPPHWAPAHGYRAKHQQVVVHRHVQPVVTRKVVVHHHQPVVRRTVVHRYYEPPVHRTVVVHRPAPVYVEPAPVVVAQPAPNILGTVVGGVIGAVIVSHVGG